MDGFGSLAGDEVFAPMPRANPEHPNIETDSMLGNQLRALQDDMRRLREEMVELRESKALLSKDNASLREQLDKQQKEIKENALLREQLDEQQREIQLLKNHSIRGQVRLAAMMQQTDTATQDAWIALLRQELKMAEEMGRPLDQDLLCNALEATRGVHMVANEQVVDSTSLLTAVLRHGFRHDSRNATTAAIAEKLVKAEACLGDQELAALVAIWGKGTGHEIRFDRLGRKCLDAWREKKLAYCKDNFTECDVADTRPTRPTHLRGVKLRQLEECFKEKQQWIETMSFNKHLERLASRTMHAIVDSIIKDETDAEKCSFAELLPPQKVDVFVSHCWAHEFKDFFNTLCKYAKEQGPTILAQEAQAEDRREIEDLSFWICSFAINQHDLDSEIGPELKESPFELVLKRETLSWVLFAVDEEASLFKRVWCLYELLRAVEKGKDIAFGTSDGLLNRQQALSKRDHTVIESLAKVEPEKADAAKPKDKQLIDECIRKSEGGFAEMKRKIQGLVSVVYRMGSKDMSFVDPITKQPLALEDGTIPLRVKCPPELGDELSSDELLDHFLDGSAEETRRLILVAEPGSGKTVLTKRLLARAAVRSTKGEGGATTLILRVPAQELPALIWAKAPPTRSMQREQSRQSIARSPTRVRSALSQRSLSTTSLPPEPDLLERWVTRHHGEGSLDLEIFQDPGNFGFTQLLLVLDGLDEARDPPTNSHLEILKWLATWLESEGGQPAGSDAAATPAMRKGLVMTSRPSCADKDDEVKEWLEKHKVRRIELLDLTEEELQLLAKKRLQNVDDGERSQIVAQLKREPFKGSELTKRPLLATMLMHVLKRRPRQGMEATVPSMPEIYEEALQIMIGNLDLTKNDVKQLQLAAAKKLDSSASETSQDNKNSKRVWTYEDLPLRIAPLVVNNCLPLFETRDNAYQLFHLSMQEYFFAREVCARNPSLGEGQDDNIRRFLRDMVPADWWGLDRDQEWHSEWLAETRLHGDGDSGTVETPIHLDMTLQGYQIKGRGKDETGEWPLTGRFYKEDPESDQWRVEIRRHLGRHPCPWIWEGDAELAEEGPRFFRSLRGKWRLVGVGGPLQLKPPTANFAVERSTEQLALWLEKALRTFPNVSGLNPILEAVLKLSVLIARGLQEREEDVKAVMGILATVSEISAYAGVLEVLQDATPWLDLPLMSDAFVKLEWHKLPAKKERYVEWRGIAQGRNGKLYCAPAWATKVLVFDPQKNSFDYIKDDGRRDGLSQNMEKYSGIALGPDGKLYCSPCCSTNVLVIHPRADGDFLSFINIDENVEPTEQSGMVYNKYYGIALGADGKLYCAPRNSSRVLIIDPKKESLSFKEVPEAPGMGGARMQYKDLYMGIAKDPDGALYCAPRKASSVLVIKPDGILEHLVPHTRDAEKLKGERKYSGIALGSDNRLYCAPLGSAEVLVIDPKAPKDKKLSFLPGVDVNGNEVDGSNYDGIVAADDGLLYCAPFQSRAGVLVIDPQRKLLSFVKGKEAKPWSEDSKFCGIAKDAKGKLYCAPCKSSSMLVITPYFQKLIATSLVEETLRWEPVSFNAEVKCIECKSIMQKLTKGEAHDKACSSEERCDECVKFRCQRSGCNHHLCQKHFQVALQSANPQPQGAPGNSLSKVPALSLTNESNNEQQQATAEDYEDMYA